MRYKLANIAHDSGLAGGDIQRTGVEPCRILNGLPVKRKPVNLTGP